MRLAPIAALRWLGLGSWRSMRLVLLLQAVRPMLPSLVNQFVSTIKKTSPGYIIGLTEVYFFLGLSYFIPCFGLSRLAHKASAFPSDLSGGQQQRVAIARALAMRPPTMLFGEPTSVLDPEMVGEVLLVMRELAREGMTLVCVTHEMGFARDVADRVWFMDEGRVLERVTPQQFFHRPQHPRAQQFLAGIRTPFGEAT